jgi:two-component system sensor histidine kinase QseC
VTERRRARWSITARLLAGVLGAVALAWLGAAALTYRDARREIDALLDAHLAQAAALLVAQASHELEEIETEHAPELYRYGRRVAFQVWERRGRDARLRLHSADAPNVPLSTAFDGFSDAEIEGRRWRVFSTRDRERRYVIHVGEERAARDRLAIAIGTNLLTPLVLALPLLGGLVWLGVRWGTRPLAALREQVVQRDPDNLAPLDVGDVPAEVAPLAESLDRLLARVHASVDSQRRFTADAAHELRTPIAAVRAHAEVAGGAATDAERRSALQSILAGCDRAAHAIDQLLTLARLDPGHVAAHDEGCDLREAAKHALADVAPIAVAKGVDVELTAGPPVILAGNPALLAILARNLVDNAVRYAAAGGVARVDIERDGATARLIVSDDGPGVATAEREALGQRFHRLGRTGETGAGLGLSIVKRIAELHGAAVRFSDGPGGRGLSVVVEFPASQSPERGKSR